ncbi:MAG: M81 family metallopeptidase [bacterium]|nr:M81 family metallopeptidase [bacterium]
MRVGIIAFLHESNTFVRRKTVWRDFENDLLATGESVRRRMQNAEHEVGGFFAALNAAGIEAVPIFASRAYPGGVIEAAVYDELENRLLDELTAVGTLDGVLAAPHGATVAENHPDADGRWLEEVRKELGAEKPLIATIDPHANISQRMVDATDALIAYGTNPHLDQKETGVKAAELMVRTLRKEVRPVQAAAFPPLAINIQNQQTSKPPLLEFITASREICSEEDVLSHSVALGFPYADVAELGSSVVVVTNDNRDLASRLSRRIADNMWSIRNTFEPEFVSVTSAIEQVANSPERTLLLDMGDNVGGGSPADGTFICSELERRRIGPSFVCLCDPESVQAAVLAGEGSQLSLKMGGKTDNQHGKPMAAPCTVVSIHEGKFAEPKARHGGYQSFDQGRTAVVQTLGGLTIMLTTRRMPPFSLEQLTSCGLDPADFRILVAKGVIAPLAAYGPVCDRAIHVNTPGATCADMTQLPFTNRRRPLFPFEADVEHS